MDDPNIAFPIFEKARELGVNLIGVHKGVPLGPQPIEHTQTWDMDGPPRTSPTSTSSSSTSGCRSWTRRAGS